MRETGTNKLNERVARLEVSVISLCDDIHDIKTNELAHIGDKIDKLDERFNILDKQVATMAIKVGFVVAILTTAGQVLLSQFVL